MGVVLLARVGVGLLSCVCAVFDLHLPREPEVARQPRGIEKQSNQDHQPLEREDVESLMVFWGSAGAADGVEHAEFV